MAVENILEEIVSEKKLEVISRKQEMPLSTLKESFIEKRSFKDAISNTNSVSIIAELKKASPSKGIIREHFNYMEIATEYEKNGASAISVLTDEKFFMGEIEYLMDVKNVVELPVLRKDFIIDTYQIEEANYYGADAILLIAAILSENQLSEYISAAEELGLDVLLEVHNEEEMGSAIIAGADIIGINNRNLKTFNTDLTNTKKLIKMAPKNALIVSESGINTAEDILYLEKIGVSAALIGGALMRENDIGTKLREFII